MGKNSSSSQTQWSLIVRAQGNGPLARAALGQLLQRYEPAILSNIRHFRHPPDQTPEEIKQEFLTRIIEREDIAALDRGKGTFRGWLRQAVRNHLCNSWDAWNAHKNPARRTDYPAAFDATSGESTEQILDRKFAADTLDYVTEKLRLGAANPQRFQALQQFLPRVSRARELIPPFKASFAEVEALACSLGMTRTALSVAVHRLRDAFKQRLTEAVADTLDVNLGDPEGKAEVQREMRLLFRALCEPATFDVQIVHLLAET